MGALKPIFIQPLVHDGDPKSATHGLKRMTVVTHSRGSKKFDRSCFASSTCGVRECFEPNFRRFFTPKFIVGRIEPKTGNKGCFGGVAEYFSKFVWST